MVDRSRKETLVEYGFRLPSALDNRPLRFEEFECLAPQTIYVSATPGPYELENRAVKLSIRWYVQRACSIHKLKFVQCPFKWMICCLKPVKERIKMSVF